MESIAAFEKVKNPVITLIGGLLLGGYVAWNSTSNIHEERVKLLEATKAELERQVAARDKIIEAKEVELTSLYAKMPPSSETGFNAKVKTELELQNLIAQLDSEIEKKKVEFARNAGLSVTDFNGRKEAPKSETYIRVEGELRALSEQRNLARQKLIDAVAK